MFEGFYKVQWNINWPLLQNFTTPSISVSTNLNTDCDANSIWQSYTHSTLMYLTYPGCISYNYSIQAVDKMKKMEGG